MKLGIFQKLLWVMVALATVPLFVTGVRLIAISKEELAASLLEKHLSTALQTAERLEEYFSQLNMSLAFSQYLEGTSASASPLKLFMEAQKAHPAILTLSLLDAEGNETVKLSSPDYDAEAAVYLARGEEPSFRRAASAREVSFSSVRFMKTTPVLDLVYPLDNKSKTDFLWVTASLARLWVRLSEIRLGRSGYVSLVDNQGITLLHKEASQIGRPSQFAPLLSMKSSGRISPRPLAEFRDEKGAELVGAFARVTPLDIGIIALQEKREAYASLQRMRTQAAGLIALSCIFGFLAALWVARSFSRPVLVLTQAAKKLGTGDFSARAEVKTKDELSLLADTFNTMTTQLKEFEDKLISQERLAAIGQMASVVGHEIRNPLAAISNAVYYIKSKFQNPEPRAAESLSIIEREVQASNKIVGDLLNFSRQREPVLALCDLNALLEEVLSIVPRPLEIQLVTQLEPVLPQVKIDRDEMRQVFLNIVSNAYQAMEKTGLPAGGAGALTVRSKNSSGRVEVRISDTGCGIAPENLKKLYQPFFSTKSKGTGLGLAVVKRVVERHGGSIAIESQVGKGTTFIIGVPV